MPNTTRNEQRCTVINPDGTFIAVANLGWLLRHSYQVERIVIVSRKDWHNKRTNDSGPAVLTAHMSDGRSFIATFASLEVCSEWVHNRTIHGRRFAHVKVAGA